MQGDQLVGRGTRVVAWGKRHQCHCVRVVSPCDGREQNVSTVLSWEWFISWTNSWNWNFVHSTALNATCSNVAHQEMQYQSLQLRKPCLFIRRESMRHYETHRIWIVFGSFLNQVILLIQLRIWWRNEPGCPAEHGHQPWPYQNAANGAYHQAWGRSWGISALQSGHGWVSC